MKKFLFYAAVVLAAISFSACSDNEESDLPDLPDLPALPATPENIAGTWQITKEEGWEIVNGKRETWSDNYPGEYGVYYTFTFTKDGSFTVINYNNDGAYNTFDSNYSISNNVLRITDYYDNLEIFKLTGSQLVMIERDEDEEQSYKYESTFTFKRIK